MSGFSGVGLFVRSGDGLANCGDCAGEPPAGWRTSWYYRYYHYPKDHRVQPHYGVRAERYKLIYFNRINEWELFDLQKDPREVLNVYNEPANAGIVRSLKIEMARLRKELDDRDQFADLQKNGQTSVDRLGPDGNLSEQSK